MRLSTIKLAGFKSFVEPTKIPFPDQMTCVVGPNGCGKSNVIDAVRWVLGESSAKNLRGDAMTDVIFNGSTNRKAISQASVELIFDNSLGEQELKNTFADRNQIAIKRLVTRDGQSLYFLNGSKCRKRDITDIFLGTGLGPRSYAIIEQGMISRLIESKPQELRVFLEEAAGVSKYKERRRETQTRIKSTRENLERLLDVRKELQSQLDKLAVQSLDAKKYRELKATERTLKSQIAVLKWQKLHQQQIDKSEQIKKLDEQISFFKTAHSGHDDVLATLEGEVQAQQDKLSDAQHQQHITHTELTRAEQQKISIKQQIQSLKQSLIKLQQRQTYSLDQKAQQQHICEELDEALQAAIESSVMCEEQVDELSFELEGLQTAKQQSYSHWQTLNEQQQQFNTQVQSQSSEIKHTQQQINHVNEQLSQLNSQLDELKNNNIEQQLVEQQRQRQTLTEELAKNQSALSQCEVTLTQQNKQVNKTQDNHKALAQKENELNARIAGLKSALGLDEEVTDLAGLLSQLIVQDGFEPLIEQALKSLTHLSVTEQPSPNSVWPSGQSLLKPSLADYITAGVYPDLLTRIVYSEHADLTVLNDDYYIAVMDKNGALHGRNWHVNADSNTNNSLLIKHKQLHEYTHEITQTKSELEKVTSELEQYIALQAELNTEQKALKEVIHQLAQQIAISRTRSDMLTEQVTQYQHQLLKIKTQEQTISASLLHLNKQLEEQTEQYELFAEQQFNLIDETEAANDERMQSDKNYSQALSALEQYKTQAHQASLRQQKARSEWQLSQTKLSHAEQAYNEAKQGAEELVLEIETLLIPEETLSESILTLLETHQHGEQLLAQLQNDLSQAKDALNTKQASLKNSQGELQGLQEQHQRLTLEEQSLLIKAQASLEPLDELKQSLKAVLETLPDDLTFNAAQNQLTGITNQLDRLGAVNLAAIEEFDVAKQRSDYLDNQLEDLTKALNTLEGAIRKIDTETKTRFKATFDQVNEDFALLFPKVFGGGSAYLELTSDDLLESGVSIMARPPGKKNSTIHLLSGGEKALTALSLVFSIFRLNPAPFCMLDEVDAPLDDANVVRFCRLVEEMSQSVQFIYISHNKIAMEMAGRLTGVTMAEPGVSRMVAVDIEQAVQLAHA
ncbi:AAA family ATPase [Pseudoalteromonas sp. CR1]|uniref:AAA family ATPase n=1 Tax=Pseudoalteromonas sp. CR1 TaxID=2861964 RepID=UPI001C5D5ACC|nr:AAA family ATPase [Pseudoalteromonas sp. CR1]MBW4968154.1 AAA family ATPase [Pseudoalteromonas sp. CR1]